jgi:hypothetical protein
MRVWLTLSLLWVTSLALATPQVLIDTDFGQPGKPFSEIHADKGVHLTGSLPEGWAENTGWKANAVATYQPVTEEGRSFLRISQTSGDGLQFNYNLPAMVKAGGYFRLTLTARSVTGGSLAMRYIEAPYSTARALTPALTGQWQDFTFDFRMLPQPQAIGLYFYLAGNGTLDVQKLKLLQMTQEDLTAEIKAKYPDAPRGNLVRISRFPLGFQSGWSLDRDYSDGDQVQIAGDPQVVGPSGSPALRLTAAEGLRVYSAPFPIIWSFATHVASLSVRGTWEGKLLIRGGSGQILAQRPLALSGDQWQRIAIPFEPVLMAPFHCLQIEGKGTLWLDGLQVEHGKQATPYASQEPLEVSLALPPSDASDGRVQFTDEPAKVAFCVTGQAPYATLRLRLIDLYGEQKMLPPVRLKPAFLNPGAVTVEPLAAHPLGTYRLEAWVEDAAGKRISTYNELVYHRLRRPRYWGKDAPNSPFGVHTLSANRQLTMAKAVGCNWVRLHDAGTAYLGWSFLEPLQGQWRFFDRDLQRYRDHHLKILGLLSTTPGWASNLGKPATGYFDRYLEPKNLDEFANYVRTVVARYRDVIDSYEVWNEPWGKSFWSWKFDETHGKSWDDHIIASDTPSADYARLQKSAFTAAHAVFPGVTILGFNTYGQGTIGPNWTRDIFGFGGLESCDALSYHHYSETENGYPGDSCAKSYQSAWQPITEKLGRVPKPVWMSEGTSLGGDLTNGFYHYTLPYENTDNLWQMSDWLARFLVSRRANHETRHFLYTMHGQSTFGGSLQWSVLITADGFLHPEAAAHSTLAWLLEDTRYEQTATLAQGVYAYLFSGKDEAVAVLSTGPTHAAWRLPQAAGLQLLDLFGNPQAAGAALGDHLTYAVCPAGLGKLKQILGVK